MSFTSEWNTALAELNPAAPPSQSAFEEHGDLLLLNYPAELSDRSAVFLGSAIREEAVDPEVEAWLTGEPFVYVSFGSFLSVRDDVLQKVADALHSLGVRAAIATGNSTIDAPDDWLVRGFLPQVRLLSQAAAAVTHGGNNSVTEAMHHRVPLLVLPFSTDQFAGAADIERAGFGVALAPNEATVEELADALRRVLEIEVTVEQTNGPDRAYASFSKTS